MDYELPPPDASWNEILKETDWALLRKQKEYLQNVFEFISKQAVKSKNNPLQNGELNIGCIEYIEGLLHFLDHIQDAAANDIGEDKVFDYNNANSPDIGDRVIVPDPEPNDLWEHSFSGTIKAFKDNNIITVEDQNSNCWDIKDYRLQKSEE